MEARNDKRFTFPVTCYGKYLYGINNSSIEEVLSFIETHNEHNLPDDWLKDTMSRLKVGEIEQIDWHTNTGKLLTMIPEYHREANLTRLS
jgi:hypothetical protein